MDIDIYHRPDGHGMEMGLGIGAGGGDGDGDGDGEEDQHGDLGGLQDLGYCLGLYCSQKSIQNSKTKRGQSTLGIPRKPKSRASKTPRAF